MKFKKHYMHTIDRQPAFFDGTQICFWRNCTVRGATFMFANSRDQIRNEQHKSSLFRFKRGYDDMYSGYSYIRVYLPLSLNETV